MIEKGRKYRPSIFVLLLVSITLLVVLTLACVSFVYINRFNKTYSKNLIKNHALLTKRLGADTVNSFATLNWIYLERSLVDIAASSDIIFVNIVNNSGEVYLSSDKSLRGEKARLPEKEKSVDNSLEGVSYFLTQDSMVLSHPFSIEGLGNWSVQMGISLAPFNKERRQILRNFILTGVIILLPLIGVAILLSRFLSAPLTRLAHETKKMRAGQLDTEVSPEYIYEVNEFATAFNKMAYSLREHVGKLKESEKTLQDSEKRIRAIVDNAADGIITIDEKGTIRSFNRAAEAIFGYKASEVTGSNIKVLMPPDMRESHDNFIGNYLKTGEKKVIGVNREVYGQHKDGVLRPLSLTVSEIRLDDQYLFTGIVRDITERRKMEEKINTSLEEKDLLLREIHHRVKNNMQIILSLLSGQAREHRYEECIEVFKDSTGRIRSMALIHDQLYRSDDLSKIDIGAYVRSLTKMLFKSYLINPALVSLELDIADISFGIDTSVPFGLLLNELVTNSLKHAFRGNRGGRVSVKLHNLDDESLELSVSDDGLGIPEEIELETARTMGLNLIQTLTKQLNGKLELDRENGTAFTIRFKELKYKKRI